jgi:SAM-dependent methyltransferase
MVNSISDLITAPWTTRVVSAAVRLKIFNVLSNGPKTVEEISADCGAVTHHMKALLDVCVSMGLIVFQDDRYMNSFFGRIYLVEGESQYLGDLIELQYDESKYWDRLYEIVSGSDDIGFEKQSEEINCRTFIKAMNNLGMSGEAEALRNTLDLSGCKEMIDAGGGSGLYSVVLCQKHPELRSTILDSSETLVITEEMVARFEEKERITFRETDITKEPFGKNIDVVLLSDVIYDETTAAPVLKNAWNCLCKKGILILRGYYSDPENSKPLFGALFVLNMLVFDPDRRIMTISSLEKKVRNTGFTVLKLSPLTERSFVLIAEK